MIYLKKLIGIQNSPAGSKVSVNVCIDFKLISLPYLVKINPLCIHLLVFLVFLTRCGQPPSPEPLWETLLWSLNETTEME